MTALGGRVPRGARAGSPPGEPPTSLVQGERGVLAGRARFVTVGAARDLHCGASRCSSPAVRSVQCVCERRRIAVPESRRPSEFLAKRYYDEDETPCEPVPPGESPGEAHEIPDPASTPAFPASIDAPGPVRRRHRRHPPVRLAAGRRPAARAGARGALVAAAAATGAGAAGPAAAAGAAAATGARTAGPAGAAGATAAAAAA